MVIYLSLAQSQTYFILQVVHHTELERKLPAIVLQKIDKKELKEYPNEAKCKLGFLDSVLRKWFCNPFNDDGKKLSNSINLKNFLNFVTFLFCCMFLNISLSKFYSKR